MLVLPKGIRERKSSAGQTKEAIKNKKRALAKSVRKPNESNNRRHTGERVLSRSRDVCVAKDTRTTSVVHMNVVSFMII